MTVIKDIPFKLSKLDVVRGLGMGPNPKVRPEIDRQIEEALADKGVLDLIHPALAYDIRTITKMGDEDCYLDDGTVFHGVAIPHFLPEAKTLFVAVTTIGPDLENKVTELFKGGQRLKGLIFDAMGTASSENMRFTISDIVKKEAAVRGFVASSPVSPGGISWPITEQFKIFKVAPAAEIGVRLTETAMMVPRKSTSMVMGMGENMPTWSATERCNRCPNGANCPYRYREEHEWANDDIR